MNRKGINIKILRNYEEDGYEVFIEGDRANAEQENSVLFAVRKKLEAILPVSEIGIGKNDVDRIG